MNERLGQALQEGGISGPPARVEWIDLAAQHSPGSEVSLLTGRLRRVVRFWSLPASRCWSSPEAAARLGDHPCPRVSHEP